MIFRPVSFDCIMFLTYIFYVLLQTLSRMLNARQLGLKLIANVTYGYTGANFSGRMPCIEVNNTLM